MSQLMLPLTALFGGGGIAAFLKALGVTTEATKPGALPGTLGAGESFYPTTFTGEFQKSWLSPGELAELRREQGFGGRYFGKAAGEVSADLFRRYESHVPAYAKTASERPPWASGMSDAEWERYRQLLDESGQISSQAVGYHAQLGEDERARTGTLSDLSGLEGEMRGSPLGKLPGEVAAWRTGFENRMTGRSDALSERLRNIGAETETYLKGIIADPNITSQEQMNQIVGALIGRSNDVYGRNTRQIQESAGARGLSPDAVAAMENENQAANYRANQDMAAQVAATNALASKERYDRAVQMFGSILPAITGQEAGIGATYGGLIGSVVPQTFQTQAAIQQAYENPIYELLKAQALVRNAPRNLYGLGEIGEEASRYNTEAEAGAWSSLANALLNMSGGSASLWNANQQRDAMAAAQPSFWDQMLGGFAGVPGRTAGTAGGLGVGLPLLKAFGVI